MAPYGEGMSHDPAGVPLDVDALLPWLADRTEVRGPLHATQLAGGRSNLTYRVTDADGRQFVLRRPPLGDLLPGAHDMSREHRAMAALADTPVPVPTMVGRSDDTGPLAAEFYVMDFVDGLVVRTEEESRALSRAARVTATRSLAATLAALHAVDPEAVGLGPRSKGDSYLARQLHVWRRQLDAVVAAGGRRVAQLEAVHERLAATAPEQEAVAIVHGDYRLDNVLIRPDGTVAAVLDWELWTLGDPMADLAITLTYWAEADDGDDVLIFRPTIVDGFGDRDEVIAAYAAAGGTPIPTARLPWYLAFGAWRLAAILEGVYQRNLAGAYGDGDDDWQQFEHKVLALADRAAAYADEAGV
jgi:aminoglycoside phosphotransferase (APT) family kinase protein